jgi:hypothetical protein
MALLEGLSAAVLACFLFLGLLLPSHAIALRALGRVHPTLRWSAAGVIGSMAATAIFHGLLPLGAFGRPAAALAVGAEIAVVHGLWRPWAEVHRVLVRDATWLERVLRKAFGRARALPLVAGVLFLIGGLFVADGVLAPPHWWDTLVYHYVKPALWLQTGGPIELVAPGGFSAYANRFAGAEVLVAWSMLPTHGDLLAPGLDVLWWLGCMASTYALGCELGLRARQRFAAMAFAGFTPALFGYIVSGMVEPFQAFAVTAGIALGARALRLREKAAPAAALSLLALSLSAGSKLNGLPILAAGGAVLAAAAVLGPAPAPMLRALLLGGTLGSLAWAPWIAWNLATLGYPLEVPLRIGSLTLGVGDPAMNWFMRNRHVVPYGPRMEWMALQHIFGRPWVGGHGLSFFWIPVLLAAPLALVRGPRGRRAAISLVLSIGLATIAFFYQREFSVVRLAWPGTASRFLAIGLLGFAPLCLSGLDPRGRAARTTCLFLWAGALWCGVVRIYSDAQLQLVPAIVVILAVGIAVLVVRHLAGRATAPRRAIAVVALVGVIAVLGLYGQRVARTRTGLLRLEPAGMRFVTRSWLEAAEAVEEPGQRHRIAVTSGRSQNPDLWFLYYFLGRSFQNELRYVRVTPGDALIPMTREGRREAEADYEHWRARVEAERITHVMSFYPPGVEIEWMAAHPEAFERLHGAPGRWGLYRVTEHGDERGGIE